MDLFAQLQEKQILSKVCSELDNHMGESEDNKELAELVLHIVKEGPTLRDVKRELCADGELAEDLVESLHNLIKRMLPKPAPAAPPAAEAKPPPPPLPSSPPPSTTTQPRDKKRQRSPENDRRSRRRDDSRVDDRRDRRDERGSKSVMSPEEQLERTRKCQDLELYGVYKGKVRNVTHFGVFVVLEEAMPERWRVVSKREGLCHISKTGVTANDAREALQTNQTVYVKIMAKTNDRLDLDMRECDQDSGADLRPRISSNREMVYQKGRDRREPQYQGSISGLAYTDDHQNVGGGRKKKTFETMTGDEKWELTQLRKVGAFTDDITHDPLYKANSGVLNDIDEVEDVDVDIERNDFQASFLKGMSAHGKLNVSPVKLTRGPDSALVKAAEGGRRFAKERRELKDDEYRSKNQVDAQQISKAYEDPDAPLMLAAAQRAGEAAAEEAVPEWKKARIGGTAFGKIATSTITQQRESLPVFRHKDAIIKAVKEHQSLVVIGETGSGKTTQITQYLLEGGLAPKGKKIGCTQPRRFAATSVAQRVSDEYGCKCGEEVGYAIRFDDNTSPKTRIKYMTDGMLLRELLIDGDLKGYSVIMLDEAHERTVNTDVLFGLLKQLLPRRPDFRLIVTSATLDAEKFSGFFESAPILQIPGRTFPVSIMFSTEDESDYLDQAIITAMQIHTEADAGDILLFLTGEEEINTACEKIDEYMKQLGPKVPKLIPLPCHAKLPQEMQQKVLEPAPPGQRKIVISTNIAETSVTLDGVIYVIDPGLSKQKRYNPKLGMDVLEVAPISQASAKQRSGRAGRTGPGECYRLYTEHEFTQNMLEMTVPEIQRTNLEATVLMMKAMGIHDLLAFPFMDAPARDTLVFALENLYALGALDQEGLLTKLGRLMSEFPQEPPLSKVLIVSVDFECAEDVTSILSMIQAQNIFYRPKEKQMQADAKKAKFHQPEGDHITLLTIFNAWQAARYASPWCIDNFLQGPSLKRAQEMRKQLVGILEKHRLPVKSAGKNFNRIRKAIVSGFFFHAAKRDPSDGYRTVAEDQVVYIHPSSSLFQKNPEWVVYHELVLTSKEYMREVMAIEPQWLPELAPSFFKVNDPRKLSKKKMNEKIEPLHNRYENEGDWRLSKALKAAARLKK